MNKMNKFLILFLLLTTNLLAQNFYTTKFNVLDDDDSPYEINSVSLSYYPSSIGFIHQQRNVAMESDFTYMKLNPKATDKYLPGYNFFALDLNTQYHFNFFKKIEYKRYGLVVDKKKKIASVYPLIGLSVNVKSQVDKLSVTSNIGGGINWWFVPNQWAINTQGMAQFGFLPQLNNFKTNNNMLRYSLGIIYKK